MAASVKDLTLAFIPGTGRMGSTLARNHARAGCRVVLGSRTEEKAREYAEKVGREAGSAVRGCENKAAAAAGDVIFWCPQGTLEERGEMLRSMAGELAGKLVVDVTNVLYMLDESHWGQTSSTLLNQEALGVPARWTTAWKSTFWKLLDNPPPASNPHSVFVCGDDKDAVDKTIALVDLTPGFKGVKAGPLHKSKIVELLGPRWILELDMLNAEGNFQSGWRFGI